MVHWDVRNGSKKVRCFKPSVLLKRIPLISVSWYTVQEVQEEGRYAIESPGSPVTDLPPEEYALGCNSIRRVHLFRVN